MPDEGTRIVQTHGSSSEDLLDPPIRGGRGLTTQDRRTVDLAHNIAGWGSDLDPAVRPGVPRDKAPELGVEALYPASIPRQIPNVKIHKSTEHGKLTPVFGTSCPPSGLSGYLRDVGYKYSEGRMARWLTLMAADRVNVVEDLAKDLVRLRVPNLVQEMGLKSEWRYNRPRLVRNVVIGTILAAVALSVIRSRRARSYRY